MLSGPKRDSDPGEGARGRGMGRWSGVGSPPRSLPTHVQDEQSPAAFAPLEPTQPQRVRGRGSRYLPPCPAVLATLPALQVSHLPYETPSPCRGEEGASLQGAVR